MASTAGKKLFATDDRQMKLRSNTHGCELKMIKLQ